MKNAFDATRPRIVIVGAGFGGLQTAKALRKASAQVTVIDRRNHHLFQPLLYQVATAELSPADISMPIRSALRGQRNTEVLLAEVTGIDVEGHRVLMGEHTISYDYLVLATGAQHSYFGHDNWAPHAPGLKSNSDATAIRREILLAFEAAEIETNPEKRQALLTFVIVGGGPTGVELAGAIAGLARKSIVRDFRHIDSSAARILLVEASSRLLAAFPEALASKAQRELEHLGVEVKTNAAVEQVDADGVVVAGQHITASTIIWAAGVQASPAGKWLGAEADRAGRVWVEPDLTVPGHPEIFVIGDTANVKGAEKPLPGVAPVAMQQGRYVARAIRRRLAGKQEDAPFHYHNKGNLATIGRSYAITDLGFIKLTGFVAWVIWLVVHIFYLIGFRNRVLVMTQWAWAYLTYQRGARLITEDRRS
ncbi:MAG TPA: NAD(P)/FAD-dependent oxidoreductase [Ktedonobacterales bacterium]|nr:NAD(P)/FAD-dependent oxidoreductase [Ktedonobacterales bacterium]